MLNIKSVLKKAGIIGIIITAIAARGVSIYGAEPEAEPKSETRKAHHTLIADTGVIMDEPDGETIIATLQSGHMFCFDDEDHDWCVGDLVTMIFDDNGTPIITDDIIISYRYSGWISRAELKNWIKD